MMLRKIVILSVVSGLWGALANAVTCPSFEVGKNLISSTVDPTTFKVGDHVFRLDVNNEKTFNFFRGETITRVERIQDPNFQCSYDINVENIGKIRVNLTLVK